MKMKNSLRKVVVMLSIVTILFSMMTPGLIAAEPNSLANGEYSINFEIVKDGTDTVSVMDGYTEKPATLYIEDGAMSLDLTLTNSDWIQSFQTEQNGSFVEAEVIKEDTEANKRIVRFDVANLRKTLKHIAWWAIAIATGLTFVGYFIPIKELVVRLF